MAPPGFAPAVAPSGDAESMPIEQRLSDIERRLSLQEQSQPIAYPAGPVDNGQPADQSPYWYGVPRPGNWTFDAEIEPSVLRLAGPQFGRFNHWGTTIDLALGYEWATGYGFKADFRGFFQGVNESHNDTDTTASTFDLDIYKRIFVDYTELVVGAGSSAGDIDFRLTANDKQSEFRGGGLNVYGEWHHPIRIGDRYEIAFIGLARMSLLQGEWRDKTGLLVPDTNDDMMTILEGSFGLEYRRRFGSFGEKYWYINVSPDFQQWQSSWMTANVGSSVGITGTSINFGVSW